MKKAFTMIELIFVIVILGILSSIALPYFGKTKKNANIVSGKADIASIRAAIVSERQTQLVRGENSYMDTLSSYDPDGDGDLFRGDDANRTLLLYGITAGSAQDGWVVGTVAKTYNYAVNGVETLFTYYNVDRTVGGTFHRAGTFNCTPDAGDCNALVK